jgi:hypothetical protein
VDDSNRTNEYNDIQEQQERHQSLPVDTESALSQESIALSHMPRSVTPNTLSVPTVRSYRSAGEISSMKRKIRQLEDQLSQVSHTTAHSPLPASSSHGEAITSHVATNTGVNHESPLFGELPRIIPRSLMHKTRLLGLSRWSNGAILVSPYGVSCAISGISSPYGIVLGHFRDS